MIQLIEYFILQKWKFDAELSNSNRFDVITWMEQTKVFHTIAHVCSYALIILAHIIIQKI